jgi:hypothetical protein
LSKIGIVQPGRIGDIIIVLPIAKYYFDKGYEVFWPVVNQYLDLFEYVDYVHPVPVGNFQNNALRGSYQISLRKLKKLGINEIIDLGIGFGRDREEWESSGLSFDEWKYREANVPFDLKYKLEIKRNKAKEEELRVRVASTHLNRKLSHSNGFSAGSYIFPVDDLVEIISIEGFTLFDWIPIIEQAKELYCIDSAVANLANALDLCVGKRYFRAHGDNWPDWLKPLLTPKMKEDWVWI